MVLKIDDLSFGLGDRGRYPAQIKMSRKSQQIFSSHNDERCMVEKPSGTALSLISLVLAVLAVAIVFYGTALNELLESRKIPSRQYQGGDATAVSDKVSNLLTYSAQAIAFLTTNAIVLALSFTAFITGTVSLNSWRDIPAITGIALSALAVWLVFY